MRKTMGIYAIVNKINGKKYIGSSSNIKKRINKHFYLLKSNKHFSHHLQNSWNKYGPENFDWHIVCAVDDVNCLLDVEQKYLDDMQVWEREYGYNVSKTSHRCTHTSESKHLLRLANLGKKYSKETNEKKACKGEDNPFYGKKHEAQILQKIRASRGIDIYPFICVETGDIFSLYTEAHISLGVRLASIPLCLNRKLYVAGGFHFAYLKDIKDPRYICNNKIELSVEEKSRIISSIDPRRKVFHCIETGEIFSSVNEAGRRLNICRVYISRCLKGKNPNPSGRPTFKYV